MPVVQEHLKGRDFTLIAGWSPEELKTVLDLADELKRMQQEGREHRLLPGRSLGMIFQKPSTRTRVSFEVGMTQLGGHALYLRADDLQLGVDVPLEARHLLIGQVTPLRVGREAELR